ncbi:MAG: hypothetical protein BWX80_03058 [Candidatus Hydrogenedentes bacterium ADurb.Bin101]|nr:MAG: hypothetical protein BWX80_03058 [Candidatus Hydrogenedentes bacterium ADurb.Bin101]
MVPGSITSLIFPAFRRSKPGQNGNAVVSIPVNGPEILVSTKARGQDGKENVNPNVNEPLHSYAPFCRCTVICCICFNRFLFDTSYTLIIHHPAGKMLHFPLRVFITTFIGTVYQDYTRHDSFPARGQGLNATTWPHLSIQTNTWPYLFKNHFFSNDLFLLSGCRFSLVLYVVIRQFIPQGLEYAQVVFT